LKPQLTHSPIVTMIASASSGRDFGAGAERDDIFNRRLIVTRPGAPSMPYQGLCSLARARDKIANRRATAAGTCEEIGSWMVPLTPR
jgi:hypothetical protein